MLDFGFYNMDCMDGMKIFPDKFFDLAIVDPPYGGVTQGGYMTNQMGGVWLTTAMITIYPFGNVKSLLGPILTS